MPTTFGFGQPSPPFLHNISKLFVHKIAPNFWISRYEEEIIAIERQPVVTVMHQTVGPMVIEGLIIGSEVLN